jgi:hypothetical protein
LHSFLKDLLELRAPSAVKRVLAVGLGSAALTFSRLKPREAFKDVIKLEIQLSDLLFIVEIDAVRIDKTGEWIILKHLSNSL